MELGSVVAQTSCLSEPVRGGMGRIASISPAFKVFHNFDPDSAVPTELFPVNEPDPIRLQLFIGRVVMNSHVPRQADFTARSAPGKRNTVEPPAAFTLRVSSGFMCDLVGDSLSEQPELLRIVERR